MRPAFTRSFEAYCFLLSVAALLLLPLATDILHGHDRGPVHIHRNWSFGPFPWNHRQIHANTNDIDIAFLGSSRMWAGINPLHVQQALSQKLGRQAQVVSICWNWAGYDALNVMTHDLLAHRKVKCLVFLDEIDYREGAPHPCSFLWYDAGHNYPGSETLPWLERLRMYAGRPLVIPRRLLTAVPSPGPAPNCHSLGTSKSFPSTMLKGVEAHGGAYRNEQFPPGLGHFVAFAPQTSPAPDQVKILAPSTRAFFPQMDFVIPAYQQLHAQAFAKICSQYHTRLIALHIPVQADLHKPNLPQRQKWDEWAPTDLHVVGIPPTSLFQNIQESELQKLYYDPVHLNANGMDYFTKVITPTLIELYAKTTF